MPGIFCYPYTDCEFEGPVQSPAYTNGYILEQLRGGYTERLCNLLQHQDGRVTDAALDATYISAVLAALEGELLLGQAALLADSPDIHPHPAPYIHAR